MFNLFDTIRKYRSRLGKPIRPIVELQKNARIVNILTTPVQDGNIINDTYRSEGWEVSPDSVASAIYIDGVFKGMGFFAGEEGVILTVRKEVIILDEKANVITASYKGIIGRLLDANLIERGSALKPSLTQTLIYCLLVGGFCFMAGMSYGR
jgi:hypothetical protein